ncbi:MAG: hypothetical protein QM761_06225 [Pseudoxanthomonas sp.]
MRVSFSLAALLLSYAAGVSAACNLETGLAPFEMAAGVRPADAMPDALEAPKVKVVSITRGVGGAPGSCDGTGILVLDLKASGGDYKLSELGFEFRVVATDSPYAVFPAEPVAITTGKRRSELLFMWSDDAPAAQKPLVMEVEVRAVTRGYLRGPPARFTVDSRER